MKAKISRLMKQHPSTPRPSTPQPTAGEAGGYFGVEGHLIPSVCRCLGIRNGDPSAKLPRQAPVQRLRSGAFSARTTAGSAPSSPLGSLNPAPERQSSGLTPTGVKATPAPLPRSSPRPTALCRHTVQGRERRGVDAAAECIDESAMPWSKVNQDNAVEHGEPRQNPGARNGSSVRSRNTSGKCTKGKIWQGKQAGKATGGSRSSSNRPTWNKNSAFILSAIETTCLGETTGKGRENPQTDQPRSAHLGQVAEVHSTGRAGPHALPRFNCMYLPAKEKKKLWDGPNRANLTYTGTHETARARNQMRRHRSAKEQSPPLHYARPLPSSLTSSHDRVLTKEESKEASKPPACKRTRLSYVPVCQQGDAPEERIPYSPHFVITLFFNGIATRGRCPCQQPGCWVPRQIHTSVSGGGKAAALPFLLHGCTTYLCNVSTKPCSTARICMWMCCAYEGMCMCV
ncbi:hypothetical protein B0I37DRAFT_130883 [Chaetomium sp. MPI-CAGE-AT-0009]|nr:hypothetical protein B0I37DRAFT_130883 [Chaetomium sp. MPI-CAGE-AT-0009]